MPVDFGQTRNRFVEFVATPNDRAPATAAARCEFNKFMNNFAQSNGFVRIGFFALHTFPINVELKAVAAAARYSTPNKSTRERNKKNEPSGFRLKRVRELLSNVPLFALRV